MSVHDQTEFGNKKFLFFYLGVLVFFITLLSPTGNLMDIGMTFLLKNQLHASSTETAQFRLLCSVPLYFGFIFGLLRDFWKPFSLGDRGYFILIAPMIAILYVCLFFSRLSFPILLFQFVLIVCIFKIMVAACHALVALLAQKNKMSGQIGALLLIAKNSPEILGAWLSSYFLIYGLPKHIFIFGACVAVCVSMLAFWKPATIYSQLTFEPPSQRPDFFNDIKRLAKHRPIYPALLMLLLFNFGPGLNTPLQYHLTNNLHAADATYSQFLAIFFASLLPGFFLYGFVCKRFSFEKLIWVAMILAVPQMLLLGFIDSKFSALVMAIPMGLLGGLAYGALYDLAIRSCPYGLQGSFMMLVAGVKAFSDRGSDVIGSIIYDANPGNGLMICALITTVVYALIVPIIKLIPNDIIRTPEQAVSKPPTSA
jgi:predicted MFS family arabinose efflux permease